MSAAPVRIRAAKPDDAAAILRLEEAFPGDRMSARAVRGFLASPRAEVRVACAGRQVVGALILLLRRNSRWARIYSVVVDPQWRGQGLGRKLIVAAEKAARAAGSEGVSLEVREDNSAARTLYAALGYQEQSLLPAYYDDGAPGIRLRKPFSALGRIYR